VQINFDTDMMIRVFEYGFYTGIWQKTYENDIRTIEFPRARVIYLEGTEQIPAKQILRLKFPNNSCYDYEVSTFNLLEHSVADLEKRGLVLLLPFYLLKVRKQVTEAQDGEERKKLSKPVKKLLEGLLNAVDRCGNKGKIEEDDAKGLINGLERLYTELFGPYKELAEGDIMLADKLDYYTDRKDALLAAKANEIKAKANEIEIKALLKVAKSLLAMGDNVEKVAKATGLPLKTLRSLQKKSRAIA
jgi:hypothetical protein